jgi:GNAT superfamily N-acetyltransferase
MMTDLVHPTDLAPPPTSPSNSYTVVTATVSDVPLAMKLVRQAKDVFPFLPGVIYEKAAADGELIICRNGVGPVGVLHFHHRRDGITTVHELVVSPHARGRGIGRLLMGTLEQAAQARGQKRLRLKCPVDQPANGFYSRFGFDRTGMEASRTRHVAIWERKIAPVGQSRKGEWEFYASLTAGVSDIRRLARKYYEGYALTGVPVPHHPFQRLIFTPLFASESTTELFRELRSEVPSMERTKIPYSLPKPIVMCDSGGYQVQMGKMTYEELCYRLRGLYASLTWGDYYVLPDHVPTSSDSDAEASKKASDTLAVGENFLAWFPERRDKFVGVVHGRTESEMRRGARHWADLGVRYIAFGSFGTAGPSGSVNLVNAKSISLLSALSEEAQKFNQKIHIFGIGNPGYLKRFSKGQVQIDSFDSAGWWKMAVFGYVLQNEKFYNICGRGRSTKPLVDVEHDFKVGNHSCPFCSEATDLRTNRWKRILHNLASYTEMVTEASAIHEI